MSIVDNSREDTVMVLHAPPSPSPGASESAAPTPSTSVSVSPSTLPKTGTNGADVAWLVLAAIALVVVGVVLMAVFGRVRRAHVH
jgi:uncharacterized protein HemX